MVLELVQVLGVNKAVTNVTVNGKDYQQFVYNVPDQVRYFLENSLELQK